MIRADRAVSELVGFVIVFGIVIGSVGILYVVGFQSMDGYQQDAKIQTADRAFEALADTVNDIQRNDGIRARTSEITLREGTISVEEGGTELTISVSGARSDWKWSGSLGALTYESGGSTIAYEGGGVFRGEANGTLDVKDPIVRCGEDAVVVSVVAIDGSPPTVTSPDGIAIEASRVDTETRTFSSTTDIDVDIDVVDSPYENGWTNVLERNGFEDGECTGRDRATIRVTTIDIDY